MTYKNLYSGKIRIAYLFIVFAITVFVYWLTAFPTITWWDSSKYSTFASCLGIGFPPGSFLLNILGWLFLKIPLGLSPAYSLNIFTGIIAALSVTILSYLVIKLHNLSIHNNSFKSKSSMKSTLILLIASVAGSLIISFSETIWHFAVRFTPYILTVLFTSLIISVMLSWWREADSKKSGLWIFLLLFLIGLDFSVHRTNSILLPGIGIWILIRSPKYLLNGRIWLLAIAGILIGLSFHLLIIPLSESNPAINWSEPDSLSRYWDYISLQQFGGNFLLNLFPRKGPFWSYQVPYFFDFISFNFFSYNNKSGVFGLIPGILGIFGIVLLYIRKKRLAIALLLFLVVTSIISILYFNLPENYFRTIYRHYLPSLIIFSVFILYGIIGCVYYLAKFKSKYRTILISLFAIVIIGTAASQYYNNLSKNDNSENHITYHFANSILQSLSPEAILFNLSDNDFVPLVYLQVAENIRNDVTVCNLSILNTDWYARQIGESDRSFPLQITDNELKKIPFINNWDEETINIPIEVISEKFMSMETFPDTLLFHIPPTIEENLILKQDILLKEIIVNNKWKRPIYFIGLDQARDAWLRPYLRNEGLVSQLLPVYQPIINVNLLKKNLLNYNYEGLNNPSIQKGIIEQRIAHLLYASFYIVAYNELHSGNINESILLMEKMTEFLPFDQLKPNTIMIEKFEELNKLIAEFEE